MTDDPLDVFSAQDSLVALMVAVSIADQDVRTAELVKIDAAVNLLPVFGTYDSDRIRRVSQTVFDLLDQEDGLDALFGLLRSGLPERLHETAYALACDVAAADGRLQDPELRLLQEIRDEFGLDRLAAAAIERGARARHMT